MSEKTPPGPVRSAKRLTVPPGADERRQHLRYELVAQLQLRAGGEVLILDVGNISAGGMLISLAGAQPDVREGDVVSVFVDIGDDEDGKPLSIDADAEVVRIIGGSQIGIKWKSDDPHFGDRLDRLLAKIGEIAVD